jgi:hypothetical protein
MKRSTVVVLLLVPMLALAGTITKTFTFSPDEVRFSKVNGYELPALRGYPSMSEPGSPVIPQAILTFVVPANATVTNVEVVSSEKTELPGTYRIHPAQTPRTLSEKRVIPFKEPNAEVYRSSTDFPGRVTDFGYTGTKTSYRLCGVNTYPIQYVPATGKVSLYTSLTLRVTYDGNSYAAVALTEKQIGLAAHELRSWIANPEDLKAFAPPVRESDPTDAEYVIVTDAAYTATLQSLADWHSKKGYTTVLKTPAWIESNYTGYDNAEKIRNFIIDYYANHGTIYVLLAGSTSTIPSRRGYCDVSGTIGSVPADLYYGDLQWSWDGDHDHVWGEMNDDTVDFYYDVYVGRAPIASVANAQTLVNKVFGYEKNPNTGYEKKIYYPYTQLWTGYSGLVVEQAIDAVTPTGWTDTYAQDPSPSTVQSLINGGYGYLHAAAHGDYNVFYTGGGGTIYSTTQAAAQTNGMDKLIVVNSIACISGNFERQDALSVVLQNCTTGGSVANMLNSREGWGTPPSMGPSELLDLEFYNFLFNNDTFTVGTAHCRSKNNYASAPQSSSVWRWCYYDLNLLGDPGMPLWTDTPGTMIVTDADSIPTGAQTVRVTVTSGGNPLGDALVGFYKASEVCARGYTNASGWTDMVVNPTTVGKLYVTVSAQNKLPVQDSIRVVTGAAMPFVNYESLVIDDAGCPSPNGRLDPGETVNFIVTLRNLGSATAHSTQGRLRTSSGYITFVDSSSSYGDIAAGATSQGDAYRLTASPSTPPGTSAGFTVHVTATEGSWDPTFNVTIGQPIIPGQVWADLDTANCLLSVTALGSIGKVQPDGQGNGFKYPKAGVSKLYYSGLLVGNSASYIVDHYYGCPASSVNTDFQLADSVRKKIPPDMGDEEYTSVVTDAGHPTPKNLRVTQRGVQVASPGYDDFTVLVYDIVNQGASAINGCYAGIMTDFDIYISGTPLDKARTNVARRLVWMRGSNGHNPTLGMKLLAPTLLGGASVIDHDRYVYPTDTAMSEGCKYVFLNGTRTEAASDRDYDWSVVVSAGPFNLPASGGSQRVAFALVGGTDSLGFLANADSAQSWYDHNSGIFEGEAGANHLSKITYVRLTPNPFTRSARISYCMPTAGRLTISAYDPSGRLVADIFDAQVKAGEGVLNWIPHDLSGGVYFLKATLPAGVQTEKFLLTR